MHLFEWGRDSYLLTWRGIHETFSILFPDYINWLNLILSKTYLVIYTFLIWRSSITDRNK